MRVFLDTNVWFSALYSGLRGSYPSIVIKLSREGLFELYFSTLVELELMHNVEKKIPEKRKELRNLLRAGKKLTDVFLDLDILKELPEADQIVLSTAVYHRMDYFLTGNTRDFGHLIGKRIGKTLILTPSDFCLLRSQ